MSNADLARIGEAFFAIEKAEGLYDWKIGGISVWVVIRSRLFRTLTQNAELYDWGTAKRPELPDSLPRYVGKDPSRAVISGRLVDGRKLRDLTSIVVPFATRDQNAVDKFSKPITDVLGDSALVFGVGTWDTVSDRPQLEELNKVFDKKYGLLSSVLVRAFVTKKHMQKYARVISFLEREVGATMKPYHVFPRWMFRQFVAQRFGYRKILKRTNAKVMYMVNAARMPLQAAAQSLGIKVIEIQSGVFSKYSLQFSWPGSPAVEYLPNEIWTWGEYFTHGIEHASNQTIRVMGSTAEFDEVRNKNFARKTNQILFLGQPLVGAQILKAAVDFAKAKPNLEVILKLHPRNDIEEMRSEIDAAGAPSNLSLMQNERSSLEMIAESHLAVGVFSTALIEAAGLGTKVAILKFAGWSHLEPLVAGGFAGAYEDAADLVANLDKVPNPGDKFFFYGQRADLTACL